MGRVGSCQRTPTSVPLGPGSYHLLSTYYVPDTLLLLLMRILIFTGHLLCTNVFNVRLKSLLFTATVCSKGISKEACLFVSAMMVAEVLVLMVWWLFGFCGVSGGGDPTERPLRAGGPHSCGLRQPVHRASSTTPQGLIGWSLDLEGHGSGLRNSESLWSRQMQNQVHDMNWSRNPGSLQTIWCLPPGRHISSRNVAHISFLLGPWSCNVLSGGAQMLNSVMRVTRRDVQV